MDYEMREWTRLAVGQERRSAPIDSAVNPCQNRPCRRGQAGTGAASASRSPFARGTSPGTLPYDEEFYEVFAEIRLP